ncbi:MAG: DUF5618 family protein [Prevotellaceae bacterium]|jgi:hypothetical protein|nr:DUF5618 family protein [Prevotellaceae bacterium]
MSIQEQKKVKEKYYNEAIRYMDNAKDFLQKAKKEGKFYSDPKYVKVACGTAYSGMLVALEGFLVVRGVDKPKGKVRKSIEFYQENMAKIDKKMLVYLNGAYQILHLSGYYDGILDAVVVHRGFDLANAIIEKVRPSFQ